MEVADEDSNPSVAGILAAALHQGLLSPHLPTLGKHHSLFPCISHQLSHCSYFVGTFKIYQINIQGEMSEIEKMVTRYLNLSCFLS